MVHPGHFCSSSPRELFSLVLHLSVWWRGEAGVKVNLLSRIKIFCSSSWTTETVRKTRHRNVKLLAGVQKIIDNVLQSISLSDTSYGKLHSHVSTFYISYRHVRLANRSRSNPLCESGYRNLFSYCYRDNVIIIMCTCAVVDFALVYDCFTIFSWPAFTDVQSLCRICTLSHLALS